MTPVPVPVPAPVIPDGITIQDDRDHLFYCVCSDTLPPIPQADRGFENPETVWPADPEHFIDRRWASNAMPYQGFLPVDRESIYQCELFRPLNYTVQSIPVFSSSPGTWAVDNTVVEKWKDVEALFDCLRILLLDGGFVPYTNLDHISFPLPWKYGYHHTKSSRKAMTRAAIRSRDAFIIMAAEISYLLALASSSDGDDRFHSWSAALTNEIGGNWVDLIRSSWLVQQDTGFWKGREHHAVRVGLFIDVRICNFSHFLDAYHRWQVPLWIDWGPLQTPFRAVDARLMSQYYVRLPARRIHNSVKAVKTVSGEHVRNREIHRVSEAYAEERSSPPQAGVKVFCWCNIGGDRLVRRRIAPAEVEQIWNEYAPSQRRYYPVQDEWDLSHEFDVDSNSKGGLLSTDDADNDDHDVLGPSEGPAPEMPRRTVKEWETIHDRMYGTRMKDLNAISISVCSLEDTLRFRFGIIPIQSSSSTTKRTMSLVEERKMLQLRRDVGCAVVPPPSKPMSDLGQAIMVEIFTGLQWLSSLVRQENKGKSLPSSQMPPECWDLAQESLHYLSPRTKPDFTVHVVRWRQGGKTGYEIRHVSKNDRYRLILHKATDVLHCLRLRDATCLDDFAEELCRYGARFSMCIDGDKIGVICNRFHDAIPYRPMGFQPELSDYAYYVRKRRALLEDPSVARAALMCGGLIWRIAMEHVGDSEFILSGPGGDMSRYGECHKIQSPGGGGGGDYDLWEESLTEDQIDLLCGVYRVYRSAAGSPTSTQDLSWFPRQCSFRNSGLDLGHWSPDSEDWYQRRVQMYLTADPKGRCLNQAEWKSYIRLWRTTVRTYQGLEVVSKAFLDRHFLQHG